MPARPPCGAPAGSVTPRPTGPSPPLTTCGVTPAGGTGAACSLAGMATTATEGLTYADLEDMPDDGRRYELSYGTLIVTPAANTRHQRIAFRLARALDDRVSGGLEVLP